MTHLDFFQPLLLSIRMLMNREQLRYLQGGAAVSLICAVLGTVSLSTNYWVVATAKVSSEAITGVGDSEVNHGLFAGTLVRRITLSPRAYDIYFTCLFDLNVCVWSCKEYDGLRKKEAMAVLRGEKPSFSCLVATRAGNFARDGLVNKEVFLNASVAATAIFFIIATIILYYCSLVLILVNCFMSPAATFLNITGIQLITIVAFASNLIALIVYGSFYDNWIKSNIGILDTLVGDYKSDASLGFSYWIFFVICLAHPGVIVLLKLRNNLLVQQRKETVIVLAKVNDPTTVLY